MRFARENRDWGYGKIQGEKAFRSIYFVHEIPFQEPTCQ